MKTIDERDAELMRMTNTQLRQILNNAKYTQRKDKCALVVAILRNEYGMDALDAWLESKESK